jgi:hypothetical protein
LVRVAHRNRRGAETSGTGENQAILADCVFLESESPGHIGLDRLKVMKILTVAYLQLNFNLWYDPGIFVYNHAL